MISREQYTNARKSSNVGLLPVVGAVGVIGLAVMAARHRHRLPQLHTTLNGKLGGKFDGSWHSKDGTLITILGNCVNARRPHGSLQHVGTLGRLSDGSITLTLRKHPSKSYTAKVSSRGDLEWSDVDTWGQGHGAA